MFGYVQANLSDLSEEERARYRAAYCGLCRTLGQRHGTLSRLSLTYDLTFLMLLLSSLYEPEEITGQCRCLIHPCKKHGYVTSDCTEYAADMTIALTYYKCLDDWKDDKNLSRKLYADVLKKSYEQVKNRWPEQCQSIETCMDELSSIEKDSKGDPDAAANCFGRLMESVFLYRKDHWEKYLRRLGCGLGRFIYLANAAVDLEQDIKHDRYNPLKSVSVDVETFRMTLMTIMGDASTAFEALPLIQDVHLLRNILYSGLWIKYNRGMQEKEKVKR